MPLIEVTVFVATVLEIGSIVLSEYNRHRQIVEQQHQQRQRGGLKSTPWAPTVQEQSVGACTTSSSITSTSKRDRCYYSEMSRLPTIFEERQ
jgi:hypothetical protein